MPSQAPVLTELLVAQGLWALWLMPLFLAFGQPPIPTRCLTAFQTSTVTQPLSRNHTPREKYQPPFQDPLPLYSFLFSLILHQCRHLFLRQQLRRLQAAASTTLPEWGTGPGPGAPSLPRSAGSSHIPRLWDLSPLPPRAFGPGVHLVLSLLAFEFTTYVHSGILQVCHEQDPKPEAGQYQDETGFLFLGSPNLVFRWAGLGGWGEAEIWEASTEEVLDLLVAGKTQGVEAGREGERGLWVRLFLA